MKSSSVGGFAPVAVEALGRDLTAAIPRDELVRPGADGLCRACRPAFGGTIAIGVIWIGSTAIDTVGRDVDGVGVDDLAADDAVDVARALRLVVLADDPVDREHRGFGVEVLAVVELHALAQHERHVVSLADS